MNVEIKVPLGQGFTAADLQKIDFPPINWIVPDVLPEGLTILAGKPKMGKSWLALDCALAVASGSDVMGRPCVPGQALFLALEDNQRRLQRRLNLIAPGQTWPESLKFYTNWKALDAGGEKDIREWIDNHADARLVIIDTLATVRPKQRQSDSAHAGDYAALRGLQQIASEKGVSVLVIHHLRKMDAEDPFDSVSGSTGLTGAADSTLILTRREGDGGCVLYGRGRDLEEFETGLEFNADTCRWRDLGDPVEAFASDTRQAIFTAIRAGHYSPAKIGEAAGIENELIKKTLQRMVRAGDLKRTGRGRYEITPDPLSLVSPCPQSDEKGDKGTEGTGVHGNSLPELEPNTQISTLESNVDPFEDFEALDDPFNPDAWA
jgi:hypothetical protein